MKKEIRYIAGISAILLVLAVALLLWKQKNASSLSGELLSVSQESTSPAAATKETAADSGEKDVSPNGDADNAECAVYITGAVKHPTLYRYQGQARVSDALDAAGGFAKNAAKNAVNLAKLLEDGEQITVPTKKEYRRSKKAADGTNSSRTDSDSSSSKVNINTATQQELMTLPGIGQSKADSILAYRSEHGSFASTEDLMQISGIKEGVYSKIKDLITI